MPDDYEQRRAELDSKWAEWEKRQRQVEQSGKSLESGFIISFGLFMLCIAMMALVGSCSK